MTDSNQLPRRTVLLLAGTTGTIALAGCGGPGEEDDEADNGNGEDEAAVEDWDGIEEFRFEGRVEAWTGVEPDLIDGEDNPTLTLIEDQEYDFTWINADGQLHNLEIRNEDGDVVDDYQSEDLDQEDDETTLEGVVATDEMATYICQYHESSQVGDITVESE